MVQCIMHTSDLYTVITSAGFQELLAKRFTIKIVYQKMCTESMEVAVGPSWNISTNEKDEKELNRLKNYAHGKVWKYNEITMIHI